MDENKILGGLEDVPVIAGENCGQCDESLTINVKLDNFSGWFGFIKQNGQMYQIPLCIKCEQENSKITAKSDE